MTRTSRPTTEASQAVWWMLLPVGLIFVSILEVINLRDIEKDRLVGKQTLTVMPGKLFAKGENIFCFLVAFLCLAVLSFLGCGPCDRCSPTRRSYLSSSRPGSIFTKKKEETINADLASRAKLALAFSALFLVGVLLTMWGQNHKAVFMGRLDFPKSLSESSCRVSGRSFEKARWK